MIEPRHPSQVHLNDGGQEHLSLSLLSLIAVRDTCLFYFSLVMLLYMITEFSTVTDLRGFTIVCKLLLICNFLSKNSLNLYIIYLSLSLLFCLTSF